jgi:hypothetical protein|eukprot:TRINITY_DN57072_c0_g1_i1.p1 TRINITY_DN57072_c0_g1~~TRINITY_DN57072_c0_g1_i1.p1  ORF type:complete len:292 (-),score=52.56 TRINITY_DN57072_c0_g1_i1:137-934(-)
MAKSIRSKIKKRLRTAKRQRMDAMVCTPQLEKHHAALQRTIQGRSVTLKKPKNAFKYPASEGSAFPQHTIMKPIDFRNASLPMATFAFRGNRRKYEGEQLEHMQNLAKTSHPKMETLAGGGAICAKTGKRLSKEEAELLATAAEDPKAHALAVAGPACSTSAVAAGVADDSTDLVADNTGTGDADMGNSDSDDVAEGGPEPTNQADHSRRPVVKDERRAARTKARRTRPNSTLKTKLPPVPEGSKSEPSKLATRAPGVQRKTKKK